MLRKIFNRNCKQIEPLLWEYAGGQMEPEQKARVDAHLVCCAGCRANLLTTTQIGHGMEALKQAPVPATQTHWAEARARLAAMPVSPQPYLSMRKTGHHTLLRGAGMAAAMALLWFALVPRGSEQALRFAQQEDNRPAKYGMEQPTPETSLANRIATMKEPLTFTKQSWPENENGDSPYLTRPIAPQARLTSASFTAIGSLRSRAETGRGRRAVRTHRFARQSVFQLAQRRMGSQSNSIKNGDGEMGAPIMEAALYRQVPNYVLTEAGVETAPHTPRAYVMDCLATDTKYRTAAGTDAIVEERAW